CLRRGLLRSGRNSRLIRSPNRRFPVGTLDAMNGVLLVLIIVVIAAIALAVYSSSKASGRRSAASLADAKADARRLIERLGGQVLNLTGADDASKQAMADASERYTAASSQIDQATTTRQAALAKESAIEGLYYVRAARTAMGMDPGPELESLTGQRSAGSVTEDRRINFEGREIDASPDVPCLRAGIRSRGGNRLWWPARGVWDRSCCSTRCSPGCTVLITAHKVSKVVTATAIPTGSRPGKTQAQTVAAGTAAAPTPAVPTATAATVAAGMPEAGTAAAISAAETSAASDVDGRVGFVCAGAHFS